jgi:hypothetical protein
VGFFFSEEGLMARLQPYFVRTSKGYINPTMVRLVFSDQEHIDLSEEEFRDVERALVNELLVYEE